MQSVPPAPPRSIYPRHVPDDLVLMIIKACNDLAGARTSTLASLCRLSKGYRALAEALLYSHVHLCAYGGVRPGTALHTLLWYPRLRAAVTSVKLSLDDLALVKEPAIALLLGDLNNVESVEAYYPEFALRKLLSSPSVRVRLFKTWAWTNELAALTWAHPAAFSTLERLEVNHVLDAGVIGPRPFSSRFSLVVDDDLHASFFAPLTAPFAADLVSLRLPLWHDLARLNLGMFGRLGHLAFAVGLLRGAASYTSIFQAAVVALAMAHTLPSLKSFAISGTLLVMDPTRATIIDRFLPLRRHQVPPTSRDLLYAIPRQIQHLALVTNAFHPSDVVAYLLSPYRAPFLKTLRVGDEVGRGLGEVLRDNAGVSAALDSAGIEVTTVE